MICLGARLLLELVLAGEWALGVKNPALGYLVTR